MLHAPIRLIAATLMSLFLLATVPSLSNAFAQDSFVCPQRAAWEPASLECPCQLNWEPTDDQISSILKIHHQWRDSDLVTDTIPVSTTPMFCNARLSDYDFDGIVLSGANFEGSDLSSGTWGLVEVTFRSAILDHASFENATLFLVPFNGARLRGTNFENSHLIGSDFEDADLRQSKLSGARLSNSNLTNALYSPESPPSVNNLLGIAGLDTLRFVAEDGSFHPPSGVQLRQLLRDAGLRDNEREVTFSLERNRADSLMQSCLPDQWFDYIFKGVMSDGCNPSGLVEGVARFVFFGLTTKWGLSPGRALTILVLLVGLMTPVYAAVIVSKRRDPKPGGGILRIWPEKRLISKGGEFSCAEDAKVERLHARVPLALAWGLYFSVLSAFQIGWRDVNVGSWLVRMQFREYVLRGLGWVRFVSGAQSLISMYLVVMWALTYFGRPFE